MNKFKMILLIIVVVVLVDFAWENIALPPPKLKLFTFTLGQIPTFLLAYIGLALGWVVGWVGHALRVRKKRRQAEAAQALSQEQQTQKSQPGQEAS
ncbi:MAG: hypothetical protein NTY36_10590 [Deltaproteobacteria bacterium]|nr:hypothetical protein [Deltaproteobacteria bacterium]